ncbi:MAG: transglycosylase domain-containing protein [Chloroflexota bacterium]
MSGYNDPNADPRRYNSPPAQQPSSAYPPSQYPPRKATRRRGRLRVACLGCVVLLVSTITVLTCTTLTILAIAYNQYDQQLSDQLRKKESEQTQSFQTARIYDRRGNELHELFGEGRRTKIKLADMPKYLIDATISVEDSTFYDNPGVDWVAISRAGLQYLQSDSNGSGGSTITQQLVRNIAFDYEYRTERSARRKIEEIFMALILTREKSKDDILEMYLNQIYYGNLAYGIEAASQTYFGKAAKDLNLAEASLLAGLPQAPADLDPFAPDAKIQEAVFARRKLVLNYMVERGKITREEATNALSQPLTYANPNVNLRSPHFTLYAEQELKTLLEGLKLPPSYLTTSGLKVYTTLDGNFQTLAENVARQQITSIKAEHNANNAAVVILQPTTGEILAMVGSVNYDDSSIQGRVNVAVSPKQPGSAMKPLTYAAAMERGFSAASILWDVDTQIQTPSGVYRPVNYDNGYRGPVRVRQALANSYNIPAVQTLREIGVETLLSFAQRVRINSLGTDASKYGLSLTLGGGELTPLELTQAYTVFANGGQLVSSTSILCVVDGTGKIVYQYENGCQGLGSSDPASISTGATSKAVLDPRIAFVISDILGDNVARSSAMGANSPLRTDGIITSVKTGTTNDYRDNWTIGYTHNVAVGVWVGNTDSSPMVHTTGLTGAAPIWHDIITGIYSNPSLMNTLKRGGNTIPDDLVPPQGLVKQRVCDLNLMRDPITACPSGRNEWFLQSPPNVPDANGKLVPAAAPPIVRPSGNGPLLVDVEPGIVQTFVQPIDPALAASLVANQPNQPVPLYCLVPNEVKDQVPSAMPQLFIKPPPFPDQAASARLWSLANRIAILPEFPCTPEMLASQPPAQQVEGAAAQITSPRPNDTVTGMVQVSGSALWPSGKAVFFKTEIQGPQFPNWTTFGTTHGSPVANGVLDQFGAEGLQPGIYKLRVAIVGVDGGILLASSEIPVNITGH